jgi:hypothetical protein
MMPALRTAEKFIRAVDFQPGDKNVLRGIVEKTTSKSVWVNTGSRVLRFATAGLLARRTW